MEPLRTMTTSQTGIDVSIQQGSMPEAIAVHCSQITPRGVILHCSPEQVQAIHSLGDDPEQQVKFESKQLNIQLRFICGDVVDLNSEAQIHSIRRISQKEFEVEMCFQNMMQDGYRQISRFVAQDVSAHAQRA